MARYSVYHGSFFCQNCGDEVSTLRLYPDTKLLTWMCKSSHLSEVNLNRKKSKKDYERKNRK
jgi:hypothetical protein